MSLINRKITPTQPLTQPLPQPSFSHYFIPVHWRTNTRLCISHLLYFSPTGNWSLYFNIGAIVLSDLSHSALYPQHKNAYTHTHTICLDGVVIEHRPSNLVPCICYLDTRNCCTFYAFASHQEFGLELDSKNNTYVFKTNSASSLLSSSEEPHRLITSHFRTYYLFNSD